MDGQEHKELIEKLTDLKQDVSDKFGSLDKAISINTVKTTSVELKVDKLEVQLADIGKTFLTHSEYEVRHKSLQDEINDHERRVRILENFKSVIFGGLILSNVVIVPIIIWLVIRQLGR